MPLAGVYGNRCLGADPARVGVFSINYGVTFNIYSSAGSGFDLGGHHHYSQRRDQQEIN
jgi:hypothetical protein